MPTALKDLYTVGFIQQFSTIAEKTLPHFESAAFQKAVFNREWKNMELKTRMRHIATCLHPFLSQPFKKASSELIKLVDALVANGMTRYSLEFMFIPDYVEQYGLDDLASSVEAMERITQFCSCEFAVRPFIIRYPNEMYQQMLGWSKHKNEKVRRFSSEGIRPRLPWAMAIPALKKDPTPILPILENLKNDPSEFVRRSVANNLNDISKDHPDAFLKIAREWKGISTETDSLLKHGSRTLLKAAHPGILKYYKLHKNDSIAVDNFSIKTKRVDWGGDLHFACIIKNTGSKTTGIRLEYCLYFLRKNGTHSKKVFKISERNLKPGETIRVDKRHSFRAITTRVYYPGKQEVGIVVNGTEYTRGTFELRK